VMKLPELIEPLRSRGRPRWVVPRPESLPYEPLHKPMFHRPNPLGTSWLTRDVN
jgi:hypothetical protein